MELVRLDTVSPARASGDRLASGGADARGRDGGVRQELAAGVLINAQIAAPLWLPKKLLAIVVDQEYNSK
jgi:hypothetical protein